MSEEREVMVSVPLSVAETINGAFLPSNPNKMRGAHPSVPAAAKAFKAAIEAARTGTHP